MRVLLMLVLCLWITACSSTPEESSGYDAAVAADGGRQIVRTASIRMEVKEVTPAVETVQGWVSELGGYIESQNSSSESRAHLVCHVPANGREKFIDQIKTLGELMSESLSAQDITNAMTDLDAELSNLYRLRNRMKALVERANEIDDILSIERELNRIQSRIDYLEQTERNNKKSVAFTKVSLALDVKETRGPLGMLFHGLFWTVGKLF